MQIVKKHGYYYLQFTFKRDKKAVSKEKYLGKNIPADIEQIKERFMRKIQGQTLFKKFDRIRKNYQKEWKRFPQSIKRKIEKELTIKFTYNTNAIEGSTITPEETKDLLKEGISPNKSLRDIQETMEHAKIFSGIIEDRYEELSLNLVKEWHRGVFKESKKDIAGQIREYLVRVDDYIAPDWQDLPKLLEDFFKWYHSSKNKIHSVELAAKAHFRFLKIHPFGDGNGRISRLIMNFILHKHKFPILIIEYKKRKSYYKALDKADKKKSEWEFLKYLYRRYLNNYKGYLENK